MDDFLLRIKAVCLVSILGGIMIALVPAGKLKGGFKSLCGVVLVSGIVLSFSSLNDSSFSLQQHLNGENEQSVSLQMDNAQVDLFESLVSSALEKKLLESVGEFEIKIDAQQQGEGIKVKSVTLKGRADETTRAEAEKMILESFPEAELIFEEASNG